MNSILTGNASDFAVPLVELAATWWLQTLILLLVGLAVAAWLQRRGPARQSVVYRVTLCAVLCCPVVSQLLSFSGVSLMTIDLRSQYMADHKRDAATEIASAAPRSGDENTESAIAPSLAASPSVSQTLTSDHEFAIQNASFEGMHSAGSSPPEFESHTQSQLALVPDAEAPSHDVGARSPFVTLVLSVLVVALAGWAVGTAWFGGRILVDCWRSDALRSSSTPSEDLAHQVCHDVALQLGVRSPRVLSTPYLSSPCLLGHWRPVVLVPEETEPSTYHQVFLHELAHLRRGDWVWNLIGRLVHALLWFQPLIWLLVRRNAAAAEDVCDDFVLEYGCNREGYLRQLIEIAEKSVPQPAMAGVSMVGFRSKLGRRAHRILDTTRVLSTEASQRFACLAFTITLALTLSVGSVYLASPQPADADDSAPSTASSESEHRNDDLVQASGVVHGPNGEPAPGAHVCFVNWLLAENDQHVPLSETTTDHLGRYELSFRKSQISRSIGQLDQWKNTSLVVRKSGFGPDVISCRDMNDPSKVNLQLAKDDLPIEGEIVDLEGRPVVGATVSVSSIGVPNGDLSEWIEAISNGEDAYHAYQHIDRSVPTIASARLTVTTDEHGRFRLNNIGRERIASLVLAGPTIARTSFGVMTRLHDPITRMTGSYFPSKNTTYGAKFRKTAAPTQVIRGIVRDAETKVPIPGVRMESWRFAGTRRVSNRVLRTESDSDGKFELIGMPKGDGNEILANPKDGQPYLMRQTKVPNKTGLGAVEVEVELHRGVVIRGRVTDKKTGQPVIARLHYLPFIDNDFAAALAEFDNNLNAHGFQTRYESKADGTYELIGLPGRAIVGVEAVGRPYRRGMGAEEIEGANEHGHFKTYNNPITASTKWPNTLVEINPAAGAKTHELDVQLDPGESLTIHVVDQAGQPVTGVFTHGRVPSGYEGEQSEATFDVVALAPAESRTLVLQHRERNIGQVVRVNGEEESRTIVLETCATVRGQLADQDGDPLVGVGLRIDILPGGDFSKRLSPVSTDREGRFEVTFLPGTKYSINAEGPNVRFANVIRDVEIEPGEEKDLGTFKLEAGKFVAVKKPEIKVQPDATKPASEKTQRSVSLQGQIVDPAGKAVSDASIVVVSEKSDIGSHTKRKIVSRTRSDKAGRFTVLVEQRSFLDDPRGHGSLNVVATKHGWGTGWREIAAHELNDGRISVRLLEEKKITGRLVNLEGQPLAGIQIGVTGLVAASDSTDLDAWHVRAAKNPSAVKQSHSSRVGDVQSSYVSFPGARWLTLAGTDTFQKTVTNSDGVFEVRGVARDHNATLAINGKGIATTLISVVARDMDAVNMPTPDSRFGTQKLYGAHFDYAAYPSRLIRGTVVDKETRKPLAGVHVEVAHTIHNTLGTSSARSDTHGRFEIPNLPARNGLRLRVKADHIPYFRPNDVEIAESFGPGPVKVNIELDRGEWIRGRMTDGLTGQPISDGWVSYYPFHANKHAEKFSHFQLNMMSVGYGDRVPINPDGTYRIVGIPGRGIVLCGATDAAIYKNGVGSDKIEGLFGNKGSLRPRVYHLFSVTIGNAVAEVHVKAGVGATCDIELEQHDRRRFRVVDDTGEPVSDYRVTGLLPGAMNVGNPNLDDAPIHSNATFDVLGLSNHVPRTLLLRHDGKKLGLATVIRDDTNTLKLLPTGSITGRAVDAEGNADRGAVVHLSFNMKRTSVGPSHQKWSDGEQHHATTQVGSDGSFRFDAIPPGIAYEVKIHSSDGMNTAQATTSIVSAGQAIDVGELSLTTPRPSQRFQ